ncbi:MAG: cation-translocating P-type ATPase [Clostridia bacterium]|nr:cation-translocating P-type ATPase [Clostridia bacterium]
MTFSSSMVTYGRGKGIVVGVGMQTEVGKIAGMINNVKETETPLQKRLNSLGKTLGIACLVICTVIFLVGIAYGKNPVDMFMTAVSLAVAAIPEGLAAVSTIVLAIGMQRMAKKNAIVKKLPAVETLGSSSVICSDKTGTLTQNKMTVKKVFYNSKLYNLEVADRTCLLEKLIYANLLCNDTKITEEGELAGDPTETALTAMAFDLGFEQEHILENPREKELPFDSERKLMTTVNKIGEQYVVYTKGGVDELLAKCTAYEAEEGVRSDLEEYKKVIYKANEEMAKCALRVLACAYKVIDRVPTDEEMMNIENDLIFIGMCGMIDPPRIEVKDAVEKCKSAGIKTVMITGDHKITAVAIAKELGILESEEEAITGSDLEKISQEELTKNIRKYSVYARVSPEHKVRIVNAWKSNGEIVAMTGDGVNDAPALKTADIGCAMGKVGTDVAKEAADVILTDDNFATIESAVEEGRRIYDNILKVIQFLLSSNIGEVVVLFLAVMLTPLFANWFGISDISGITPLLAIHILWVNLVTDSLPALALAVDPAEKDIMNRPPRKNTKGIFTGGMIYRVVYQGIMIGILTLLSFVLGLATTKGIADGERIMIAQTMAFIVLAFSELVHVFNVRNNEKSIFKTGILSNKKLLLAIAVSSLLILAILFVPQLREIFSIAVLPKENIFEVIVLIIAPLVIVEILKLLKINTLKGKE